MSKKKPIQKAAKPGKPPAAANPTRLTHPQFAELLSKMSKRDVAVKEVQEDIAKGAPTNEDNTINLIHYCAWLVAQVARK